MPRYRVQFSKEGPARFLSHLDLVRTTERALRRARLPLAFSQGFNPHPRFSFAAPLPVGVAGEQEYLDIELEKNISPKEIISRLNMVFPEGIRVKEARPVSDRAPSLMATLKKARYEVEMELSGPLTNSALQGCLDSFLALSAVEAATKKKDRQKTKDIRPGIYRLQGKVEQKKVVLEMELQAGSSGNVRPEEVCRGLLEKCGLPVLLQTCRIKRTGLFFEKSSDSRESGRTATEE